MTTSKTSHITQDLMRIVVNRNWLQAERELQFTGRKPKLWRVLIKTFLRSYWTGGFMKLIAVLLSTVSPLLFSKMIRYWSTDSTMSRDVAMYYAIAMIFTNWISSYFNHQGFLLCQQFGMKIRVATSSLMFRKIMRMSNGSLGDTTAGKVVNLLSNDMQRFDLTLGLFHFLWLIPLQAIIVIYFGYMQTGYAAFAAFGTMILIVLPIQGFIAKTMGKVRLRNAEKTDERIKVMSEVINGIRVIKMYAWEIPFQKVVKEKRRDELKEVKKATVLRTLFLGFMLFTEKISLFVGVLVYLLLGNSFSANMFYALQQLMGVVLLHVTLIMPMVWSYTAEMIVSLDRIEAFLHMEDRPDLLENVSGRLGSDLYCNISVNNEFNDTDTIKCLSYRRKSEIYSSFDSGTKVVTTQNQSTPNVNSIPYLEDIAVTIHNVSASWVGDPNMMALKNITTQIRKGKLCAIIGAVGSGKSSILQLLLKELPPVSGTISINGKISYACQEAWLLPITVRENILFGLPFDPQKYSKVNKACALEKDFRQFPYGDQTLVGERGVSLSGGQRARINLARAVYRESDIYLLDDPLSAVDANVGRQLFEQCINEYLLGKTRILVTHQVQFLKAVDYIIVLKEGHIENMGTYHELIATSKEFTMLLSSKQDGKDKNTDTLRSKGDFNSFQSIANEREEDLPEFEAQVMAAEERASGNLSVEVIASYFRSGGRNMFLLHTVFMIALAFVGVTSVDYWISFWANQMATYSKTLEGQELETNRIYITALWFKNSGMVQAVMSFIWDLSKARGRRILPDLSQS